MAIMGKYYEYYGDDFVPPRTLGRMNAERMVQEVMMDNMGFCRFHREWAETLLPDFFRQFIENSIDVRSHHVALARRINARNQSAFWESGRVVRIVEGFLHRKAEAGETRPELGEWLGRFAQDPWQAGRDFFYEIRKGVDEALAEFAG